MSRFDSIAALLDAHGLAGVPEQPFVHTGFSGATLTRLVRRDGEAFVLKRMSIERDWIMRATDDASCREAVLATRMSGLPDTLRSAVVGVARDDDTHALLMLDISSALLPPGQVSEQQLDLILQRMAELHASPPPKTMAWCDLARRLTLLTPATATIAQAYGAPVARDIISGWETFDAIAPAPARGIIGALRDEPTPLLVALQRMPSAFLHGDLKLDNIGLDATRGMWLIDWAMTLVAPPAVELGWFLAINSQRLPCSLAEVMQRYARVARIPKEARARNDALTVLCGLLLRGWRKALDADAGDRGELDWWCERVAAAAEYV